MDLRYIQELFGHKGSKTTERDIYTHVNNKNIGKIKSPLDSLQIKGGGDERCGKSSPGRMYMRTMFGYTMLSAIGC